MASEIRANTIKNRVGLGTIEYSNTGPIISGVTTALNFKTGTSNLHNTGLNVQDLDVDGHTNLDNVSIAGVTTTTDNIDIDADNKKLQIGASQDLQLFHDGGHSRITNTTGILKLTAPAGQSVRVVPPDDSGNVAVFHIDGSTHLYYDSAHKFSTLSDGIEVVGNMSIMDSIYHRSDDNTKIRFPANDTITFETAASERLRIDSTGGVIIGTGNDSNTMSEFGSNTGGLTIDDAGVANTGLRLSHGNDDTYLIQSSNSNFYISQYGTGNMIFGVGASGNERLRITSDGQIRIDQATSANNGIRMRPSGWNYDFRIGAVSSSGGSIWLGQNYEPTGGTRDSASYGTNYIQFTTGGTIHFGTGATNTNPTARMNISSEGYITKPTNLCLQYTPSGSIDLSSGTLIYATEVYDVGNSNAYNTSNGEFTAPVTGVYRIHYEHFANNGRATTNIEKDTGSGYSVIKIGMRVYSQAAGANWSSVPTIYYAQLNSGDKIRITRREGTVHLNSPWNHLTIQLVQ